VNEIKEIGNLDRLIHEPARLAILAVLFAAESADFTYLLNATHLSKGNLSVQLSKLEDGGYLTITKGYRGKRPNTSCALTNEGRRAFEAYWKQYRALADRLNMT
jgi:DNA-binding MarR family transcriptional regulator